MVNREPQHQKIIGWGFLYLLFSQEALAARVKLDDSETFIDTEENDGEALLKLEELHNLIVSETQQWMSTNGLEDEVLAAEDTMPASFTELDSHLDETVLGALEEKFGDMNELLEEAEKEVLEAARQAEVENLSIFICKRSMIEGYQNEGSIFHKERTLSDQAHMSVRCSQRTAIVMNGQLATSEDSSTLKQRIENLKTLTHHDKKDSDFPISVKVCTSGDCSQRDKDAQAIPTEGSRSNSVLFGDALSDAIPVPSSVIDDLPSPRKNHADVFAICFDDQDECGGMMWLPKNMHSCNGWFGRRDARLQLAHIRDSMKASFFSTSPIRRDASQRAMQELHSQNVNDADFETIDHVQAVHRTGRCPLEEWKAKQEAEAQKGFRDLLNQVQQHVNSANQASMMRPSMYNGPYGPDPMQQRQSQQHNIMAGNVCLQAKAEGHNDCSELRSRTICDSFMALCASVGINMQTWTEPECHDPLQPPALLEADEVEGSLVSQDSTRGWKSDLALDLLFPPVYYGYQPYCYSWHHHGGSYYAYPIVPSVGGRYGYGAYSGFHPAIWTPEEVILFHSIRAVAWVGLKVAEGTAKALVNSGLVSSAGDQDGLVQIITIGLVILTVTLGYCFSSEERCKGPRQSRFFRHGRLARQGRMWANTWEAIENKVYDTGGHLLFDADVDTGSRCNPSLQYGRKWVRKSDAKGFAAAANVTMAGASA